MLKSRTLKPFLIALALAASVIWPGSGSALDAVGTLTGAVTDAAGAPLAGAFVQMKNAERRLNFMVITQEQGKYTNDRLPAGKYVVQAIGGEHQSAPSAAVDVAAGNSASVDLSLTVARAPALPGASPGRQPGERGAEAEAAAGAGPRLPDGEGKAIVEAKSTTCGRLDPATGVWTEFPLMYAESDVRRIEVDPNNPKRVWYSGVLSSRIGYVELMQ